MLWTAPRNSRASHGHFLRVMADVGRLEFESLACPNGLCVLLVRAGQLDLEEVNANPK